MSEHLASTLVLAISEIRIYILLDIRLRISQMQSGGVILRGLAAGRVYIYKKPPFFVVPSIVPNKYFSLI